MTWTNSQIETIILTYAHEGHAFCPFGHGSLVSVLGPIASSSRPVVHHHCSVCHNTTRPTALAKDIDVHDPHERKQGRPRMLSS